MHPSRSSLVRATRVFLLACGAWLAHETTASAQFGFGGMGYGGMGYGGMGYGGLGYGGMGYGGLGGGYGGFGGGYGGLGGGYGGFGGGYGGFGGGYGGFGGGYGGFGGYAGSVGGLGYGGGYGGGFGYGFGALYPSPALGGVGYPGISWQNPYFGFGLSPLAVQNAVFERAVLGRTTPPLRSSQVGQPQPVTTAQPALGAAAVGTGTFQR